MVVFLWVCGGFFVVFFGFMVSFFMGFLVVDLHWSGFSVAGGGSVGG